MAGTQPVDDARAGRSLTRLALLSLALVASAAAAASTAYAHANVLASSNRTASLAGPLRAPGGPPLALGSIERANGGEEASPAAPDGGEDVLTGNGLDSPLCRQSTDLSLVERRNCDLARFAAGPYPTDDYMFDVNVDTGVGRWSNDASALLQNIVQIGWMGLVSLTRGLVVMIEWCYSLGTSGRDLIAQATDRLRAAGLAFTEPLLGAALSLAAALTAYHGLIRRRAAETVAQALATLAMIAAGLWLIVDPLGTVGALQQWSDEAGAGTLAALASGTPQRPTRTLADGLSEVFDATVTAPWCYMEFGSVRWCQAPDRLDRRLQLAAARIAVDLRLHGRCRQPCTRTLDQTATSARISAALLEAAHTNGQLFLALPVDGPLRNSTKASGTLLNVLCGGSESANRCSGPTAAQAEFRSERGTYGRAIGLLLIWIGGLGMLLLFGSLAVRLLLSGVLTVGYLLLAPALVLAPVLGESGRSAFRSWIARLLTAAGSKLVYSFLLGVALAVTSVMLRMTAIGWWAQWLLLSAFWWTAFVKRHQTLALVPSRRPVRTNGPVLLAGVARWGHGRRPASAAVRTVTRTMRVGPPASEPTGAGDDPIGLSALARADAVVRPRAGSARAAAQSAYEHERSAARRQARIEREAKEKIDDVSRRRQARERADDLERRRKRSLDYFRRGLSDILPDEPQEGQG
jgi:hypothetical protein